MIKQLPQTPNVGPEVPNSLWNWLIEIGNRMRQLIEWVNDYAAPTGVEAHASTHATGGSDELTPADIGAATDDHTHLAASGTVVQSLIYSISDVGTGTTALPVDDTIPQSNEGTEFMSTTFTPLDANSTLEIKVIWQGATSSTSGASLAIALFQDSIADALEANSMHSPAAGAKLTVELFHPMTAGTTNQITFKVRAGTNTSSTITFNGYGGARKFGGVMKSYIIIKEIAA